MKLVALRDISDQLPKGTVFDWRDDHAETLIAIGVARKADEAVSDAPKPSGQARGNHVGAQTYRRRDMKAED